MSKLSGWAETSSVLVLLSISTNILLYSLFSEGILLKPFHHCEGVLRGVKSGQSLSYQWTVSIAAGSCRVFWRMWEMESLQCSARWYELQNWSQARTRPETDQTTNEKCPASGEASHGPLWTSTDWSAWVWHSTPAHVQSCHTSNHSTQLAPKWLSKNFVDAFSIVETLRQCRHECVVCYSSEVMSMSMMLQV